MARLSVSLLGPFQVTLDGKAVTKFESAKVRGLLAFLAAEAAQVHTRDALAELFWPDRPPGAALADLRHALANLRKAIGDDTAHPPFLLVTPSTLQFNPAGDAAVDLALFKAHLRAGMSSTPAACRAALALRRGSFLAGCRVAGCPAFEEWLLVMGEQVDRLTALAYARLTADCVQRGDFSAATEWSRQHLALEPWNEDVHQELIRQLAMSGQTAAALHQYEICRRTLANELGVEPQPATQALIDAVRHGAFVPQSAPEPSRPGAVLLPPRPLTFFGRAAELDHIESRLADPACRLLTVSGPGGMGKTVLAVAAAHAARAHFRDGVCLVDLTPVAAADELPNAILRALGLPTAATDASRARLHAALHKREMLLVLDNFEHLLAGADLLPPLLHAAPGIKLLVTSRTRLRLVSEWLLPLEGLATPPVITTEDCDPAAFAGVQLFMQRARQLNPVFAPTPAELAQIGVICRRLDGMPLAIELAAAWLRSLPLDTIAAAVCDRLDLFASTLRDIPARHRSMQAVFDHSWQLLDARAQTLLRQLAVFRGGWTAVAAEAVAGATLADLEDLVDQSWLRVHDRRFSMHELMRQYCEAKLREEHTAATGEAVTTVHQRHCIYFAGIISAEDQALNWRHEPVALFNLEFGNLEAAWRWAIAQDEPSTIRQMMIGLFFMAEMTGGCGAMVRYFEDAAHGLRRRRLNATLSPDQREEAGLVLTTILFSQVILLLHLGWVTQAGACVDEMGEIVAAAAGDARWTEQEFLMRWAAICLGVELGDFAEVYAAAHDLLIFAQTHDFPCYPWRPEIGTRFWQMQMSHMLGVAARHMGDYAGAMHHAEAALDLGDAIGEGRHNARNLREIAALRQLQGEYEQARVTMDRALELHRIFDDRLNAAHGKLRLGAIEFEAGHLTAARDLGRHCLAEAQATDEYLLHLLSLVLLARCDRVAGDLESARRLLEQATRLARQPEVAEAPGGSNLALEWGYLACAAGDWAAAQHHFANALAVRGCDAAEIQAAHLGQAIVAQAQGDPARARQLLNQVIAHRATAAATRTHATTLLAAYDAVTVA